MEITEVRIKLMEEPGDRLQAFCSITIDGCFVIRDLKIIQGTRGSFVAMPSRKLNDRCPQCGSKNELRAGYCSSCGCKLNHERALRDQSGRAKLYADIAHPINTDCREMIQDRVLAAFEQELVRSQQPGYICRYDDYGESEFADSLAEPEPVHIESDTARHRIEPAGDARPPHHAKPKATEKARPSTKSARIEDTFGAGLE